MPIPFWPASRGFTNQALTLAPAMYEVEIDNGDMASFGFASFTSSVKIASDQDVYFGLTPDGVTGTNRWPVGPTTGVLEAPIQTRNFYVLNDSGSKATVNVLVIQSASFAQPNFGDICKDNGFDGGDSSDAVTVAAAPGP